ncbi:uncharacterized protein LOC129001633 [Macrosteles quadrilineatus]|uniref:uncharacterized protein LOC128995587 n=1 Tax=Macrosteles quadrilineatus TaxID=74068 RepID=UPI0023E13060|nr:uncharacterized protein LOC128995587 [Macrosteles quadrilineatus]XP_054284974.1 uncharacterized protein LOC129001633 [Macrosteles quadrilineatus]
MSYQQPQSGKMSERQRDFLIAFLEQNPKLATNQLDAYYTREVSNKKWEEATIKLNSLGGAFKTVKQWKRTWTDLKVASKKKAANMRKNSLKTGGGPVSSSSEDDEDQTAMPVTSKEPAASMPATERVLSLLGKTAVEGIRGIMEIGIDAPQYAESDYEDDPLPPPPKRPNLRDGDSHLNSKRKVVGEWVENSKKKAEAMQSIASALNHIPSVASALNNIANQIGRLADCFDTYNKATI